MIVNLEKLRVLNPELANQFNTDIHISEIKAKVGFYNASYYFSIVSNPQPIYEAYKRVIIDFIRGFDDDFAKKTQEVVYALETNNMKRFEVALKLYTYNNSRYEVWFPLSLAMNSLGHAIMGKKESRTTDFFASKEIEYCAAGCAMYACGLTTEGTVKDLPNYELELNEIISSIESYFNQLWKKQ